MVLLHLEMKCILMFSKIGFYVLQNALNIVQCATMRQNVMSVHKDTS